MWRANMPIGKSLRLWATAWRATTRPRWWWERIDAFSRSLTGGVAMEASYVLACGIVWRKTADPEAGWELVQGIESRDPALRLLARTFLCEGGERSIGM